jgi:AcrR family transcriptional regulator
VDRDRKILDAAATVFYEKGFHGVGMDELGVRAGLSGPALYRHFSGKAEILAALFNEAMDELLGATVMVHEDPFKDLDRMIRHHVEFAVARRPMVNIYQREDRSLTGPWRRHFDRRRRIYVERWEAAVGRCFPEASPPQVAAATQLCLGLIFSVAYWPPKVARTPALTELVQGFVHDGLGILGREGGS